MDTSKMMDAAMSGTKTNTGAPDMGATDTTEQMPEEDGTVTVPLSALPPTPKEGDVIQMTVVLIDGENVTLKPIESRVRAETQPTEQSKKMGIDTAVKAATDSVLSKQVGG